MVRNGLVERDRYGELFLDRWCGGTGDPLLGLKGGESVDKAVFVAIVLANEKQEQHQRTKHRSTTTTAMPRLGVPTMAVDVLEAAKLPICSCPVLIYNTGTNLNTVLLLLLVGTVVVGEPLVFRLMALRVLFAFLLMSFIPLSFPLLFHCKHAEGAAIYLAVHCANVVHYYGFDESLCDPSNKAFLSVNDMPCCVINNHEEVHQQHGRPPTIASGQKSR